MAAMEPIVVALEIDEFRIGASKVATTWPTGTMLTIEEIKDSSGNSVRRPDGRKMIRAYPLGQTAREGIIDGKLSYMRYTLTTNGTRNPPIGRFIHAPNADGVIRGNENVIYFTPPSTTPGSTHIVLLADPCTVGGPSDEIYDSPYFDRPGMLVCGPKFVSAAVGGVCALDWNTYQYGPELKNGADLKNAYAGAPAFLEQEITTDTI
jgi:hypothetical protein